MRPSDGNDPSLKKASTAIVMHKEVWTVPCCGMNSYVYSTDCWGGQVTYTGAFLENQASVISWKLLDPVRTRDQGMGSNYPPKFARQYFVCQRQEPTVELSTKIEFESVWFQSFVNLSGGSGTYSPQRLHPESGSIVTTPYANFATSLAI